MENENKALVKDELETKLILTQEEIEKKVQSAEDKVRTKYSKELKDSKQTIDEINEMLDNINRKNEESQKERDIRNKIEEIEKRENRLNFTSALMEKGLPKNLIDFIRDDIEVDDFISVLKNYVSSNTETVGYIPTGHQSNEGINRKQWSKMTYDEKIRVFNENPELAKKFMK